MTVDGFVKLSSQPIDKCSQWSLLTNNSQQSEHPELIMPKTYPLTIYCIFLLFLSGCSYVDPRQIDIDIPSGTPEVKKTALKEALQKLGKMAEIYGVETKVMLDKISDNTGTSVHTKAELPYDVTEITASALNSIGSNIAFLPYRPDIMANLKSLNYQNFENKFIPSAIVTGGITEFDRGLETREASGDFGYDTNELGDDLPLGLEYSQGKKTSVARITIDYNLIDIPTMSGISGIQTTNTMLIHKGIKEKEIGLTLLGPTFGVKGEVKKVEGRHAALRLLIQASMVQLIGKYLDLPYWRLLPGAPSDPVVESYVSRGWHYQMNQTMQIEKIQELLILHGYEKVSETGEIDQATQKAIEKFSKETGCSKKIDFDLYTKLYYTVPLDDETLQRRYALVIKKQQERIKAAQEEQARLQAAQQEQARLQAAQQEQVQQQSQNVPQQHEGTQ